jgi:hypothetical protein
LDDEHVHGKRHLFGRFLPLEIGRYRFVEFPFREIVVRPGTPVVISSPAHSINE